MGEEGDLFDWRMDLMNKNNRVKMMNEIFPPIVPPVGWKKRCGGCGNPYDKMTYFFTQKIQKTRF